MHLKHAEPQVSVPPLHCLCAALLDLSALDVPPGQLVLWKVPGVVLQIKVYIYLAFSVSVSPVDLFVFSFLF